MTRGDIVLGRFPHAADAEPKQRPVLVVQSDFYNTRLRNVLVAAITSNLARQSDPAHLLIDVATAEGSATGLPRTSVVSCLNLAAMPAAHLGPRVGRLSESQLRQIDACLVAALGIGVPGS
jgi:mRNA-degrading endonuclease toxin of MazEF toxin-antitoxin module